MASLRLNVASNFVAQAWGALLALLLVPAWLHLLGAEGFGLVGLFLALQSVFPLLDLGLGAAFNRELATRSGNPDAHQALRDTARTLEWLALAGSALVAFASWSASATIATRWLSPDTLGTDNAREAVALMGLAIAAQWPSTLYIAGFRGLQRQLRLNAWLIGFHALRHLGALAMLLLVEPTIQVFTAWQVFAGLLQTIVLRQGFWRILPAGSTARARLASLRPLWRFAAGTAAVSALGMLLMQGDRLILSARVTLEAFGIYVLAATLAGGLALLSQPLFHALFPRYAHLVASRAGTELARLHHRASQWLSMALWSVVALLAWMPREVLWTWTGDARVAAHAASALALLAIGTGLNATMSLPYALQLAHGWTRLAFWCNAAGVVLLLPAIWWAAGRWGGTGAAAAWLALNLGVFAVGPAIMHRRLLRGELAAWYLRDTLMPAFAALGAGGLARMLLGGGGSRLESAALLAAAAVFTLLAGAAATPAAREWLAPRRRAP